MFNFFFRKSVGFISPVCIHFQVYNTTDFSTVYIRTFPTTESIQLQIYFNAHIASVRLCVCAILLAVQINKLIVFFCRRKALRRVQCA